MPKTEGKHFYSWLGDALTKILEKRCGKDMGFCLLIFTPTQTKGAADYVSNTIDYMALKNILTATANSLGKSKKGAVVERISSDISERVEPDNSERVSPDDNNGRVKPE